MKYKIAVIFFVLASLACSIPVSVQESTSKANIEIARKINTVVSAPTPSTTVMTTVGVVHLRDAPDNTGSRTLAVLQKGEIFHVQRRTTVMSTEWCYGSWYDKEGKKWITGYVAARFLW